MSKYEGCPEIPWTGPITTKVFSVILSDFYTMSVIPFSKFFVCLLFVGNINYLKTRFSCAAQLSTSQFFLAGRNVSV